MSAYHQQSFAARHGALGDQAERIFDELHGERVHTTGLNRYWKNGKRLTLKRMPLPMRYVPDRMLEDRFVEVMGLGRDQMLKLKVEKAMALQVWQAVGPVSIFVYDSHKNRWWEASVTEWMRACATADVLEFHDGKRYFALPVDQFPCEAVPL